MRILQDHQHRIFAGKHLDGWGFYFRGPRGFSGLADVKSQAQEDKLKCELVRLPKLEKRLQELQAAAEEKE